MPYSITLRADSKGNLKTLKPSSIALSNDTQRKVRFNNKILHKSESGEHEYYNTQKQSENQDENDPGFYSPVSPNYGTHNLHADFSSHKGLQNSDNKSIDVDMNSPVTSIAVTPSN